MNTVEEAGARIVQTVTSKGTLTARWELGPDGDWWQVEYPVKSATDLPAAVEAAGARSYILDPGALWEAQKDVGVDGVVPIEIPRRPYSDLLHEFVGWGEGLMLLFEPEVGEILDALETKLRTLTLDLVQMPGSLLYALDNLDGQFISPRVFKKHLAESYRFTTEAAHSEEKQFVTHIGGPVRHLLAVLAQAGIDGLEGIAGAPQSNVTLSEARELTGPGVTLWGGVPQDYLLPEYDEETFQGALRQAMEETKAGGRTILGVADRVPTRAVLERLAVIQDTLE